MQIEKLNNLTNLPELAEFHLRGVLEDLFKRIDGLKDLPFSELIDHLSGMEEINELPNLFSEEYGEKVSARQILDFLRSNIHEFTQTPLPPAVTETTQILTPELTNRINQFKEMAEDPQTLFTWPGEIILSIITDPIQQTSLTPLHLSELCDILELLKGNKKTPKKITREKLHEILTLLSTTRTRAATHSPLLKKLLTTPQTHPKAKEIPKTVAALTTQTRTELTAILATQSASSISRPTKS